jgi:Arc/MetJ-type ribon-helix-helix transcriptional regulator
VKSEPSSDWRTPEDRERDIAQAQALREQASRGGLRFEAFLPPGLADWILDLVARGVFADPSEALFVLLGEQRELEPHADLRQEILKRSLQAALDDPRPGLPAEEFKARMRAKLKELRPEPAVWTGTRMKRTDRRVFRTEDLTDEEIALIAKCEVPPGNEHLDELLKDWEP